MSTIVNRATKGSPLTITELDNNFSNLNTDKQERNEKDVSGGYAGLTLLKLNIRNVANTITSWITNSNTASRTYTLPDKDGVFVMTDDTTKQTVWIPAIGMSPGKTSACSDVGKIQIAAGQPDISTLDFNQSVVQECQFTVSMPKSWNQGTVSVELVWSHAAGTGNVVWGISAVCFGDTDAIGVNFGTEIQITDNGGTANMQYVTADSGAITIANTPASKDLVYFKIRRIANSGTDTLNVDSRLHGMRLYYTSNAYTDA